MSRAHRLAGCANCASFEAFAKLVDQFAYLPLLISITTHKAADLLDI
ncbi:hypothetical protein [Mycobacterium sp.]